MRLIISYFEEDYKTSFYPLLPCLEWVTFVQIPNRNHCFSVNRRGHFVFYLLQGATLALPATLMPGPFQAFLISCSLRSGWKRTLPAAFAPLATDSRRLCHSLFCLENSRFHEDRSFSLAVFIIAFGTVGRVNPKIYRLLSMTSVWALVAFGIYEIGIGVYRVNPWIL